MAPRRQAALAAQANMAAFAALEIEADHESPEMASTAPKAAKVPKATKVVKSAKVPKATKATKAAKPLKKPKPSNVKTDGKGAGVKSADKKSSDAKNSDGNSIPLLCCVCHSFPRFSDVSHLLTHLSSKGHLHTLNNLRLSALADLSAMHTVTNFDKWYNDNNLQQLLAERLQASKEGKRPGQPLMQPLKKKKTFASIKAEADGDAPWNPSREKKNIAFEHQEPITFFGSSSGSPATSPTETTPDNVEEDLEVVRLKGIIWPGMSLFDAATPEQRKKRNQRKDASVLQQMELDSQAVTSTEIVANLTLEIERTRDVYDAPSVEGTPPTRKPRGRQRRNRVKEDIGIFVKAESESDDEPPRQATHAMHGRVKKEVRAQEPVAGFRPSPEANIESLSERFEVASDEDDSHLGPEAAPYADVSGGSNTSLCADLTADVDDDADPDDDPEADSFEAELNTSRFAEEMNNFHTTFTIPDASDVFQDGSAGQPRARPEYMQQARFDVRNRFPLQPMNPNSSMSLASPTPTAKQFSHRNFRGKENNRGLQDQGLGNHHYIGGPNTHLNQRTLPMGTVSPFNTFPQPHSPDMIYHDFSTPWIPSNSRVSTTGFNPINGHAHHQPYFANFFPMTAHTFGENEQGHGMSVFGDGV